MTMTNRTDCTAEAPSTPSTHSGGSVRNPLRVPGVSAVRFLTSFLGVICVSAVSSLLACGEAPPPPPPPRPPAPMTEEEDDGVMVDSMGSLSRDKLEQGVRRVSPQLMGCYEQGLRRIGYLSGDVQFHIGVARDGSIKWAFVAASQLGDHAALQCMLDVLRGSTFPRPQGNDTEAIFDIQLEPPNVFTAPATWTPNDLQANIDEHRLEIDACLDGTTGYALTLYVATGGTILAAGATPPDAEHQEQADCLAAAAATWVVPDPGPGPTGAKVTLEF